MLDLVSGYVIHQIRGENALLAGNERPTLIAKAFVKVDTGGDKGTTGILANTCERGPLEDESGTTVH